MKSFSNNFQCVTDLETLSLAIDKASLGKRNRHDVVRVRNHKDEYAELLAALIKDGRLQLPHHEPQEIRDGTTGKQRFIIKPTFYPEQCLHHSIVYCIQDDMVCSSYTYSCGSMPKRGADYGRKVVEKWIHYDAYECKYFFKCDIHHFFESIDTRILKKKLKKRYGKDRRFYNLICAVLASHDKGLPLGFYTSQWFANYYLEQMDYYIKQTLGCSHYIRYMDDIVIFSHSKQYLHWVQTMLRNFLRRRLHLELKKNYQIARFTYRDGKGKSKKYGKWKGRDLDFMGYRFTPHGTFLRKNIMIRASRKARNIAKKGANWYKAAQMISYLGWFDHTNSYSCFQRWIKPYVKINQLRRLISKHSRRVSERAKLEMERRCRYAIEQANRG